MVATMPCPGIWPDYRDGDGRIDVWGLGTVGKVGPGFQLSFSPLLFSFGADYLTPDCVEYP